MGVFGALKSAVKKPAQAVSKAVGKAPGMQALGNAVNKAPGMKPMGAALGIGPSPAIRPQPNPMAQMGQGMAGVAGQMISNPGQGMMRPDVMANRQAGEAAGQDMSWMDQPGALALGPSQDSGGLAPSPQMTPAPPPQMNPQMGGGMGHKVQQMRGMARPGVMR